VSDIPFYFDARIEYLPGIGWRLVMGEKITAQADQWGHFRSWAAPAGEYANLPAPLIWAALRWASGEVRQVMVPNRYGTVHSDRRRDFLQSVADRINSRTFPENWP
jgi:hypothetical protein